MSEAKFELAQCRMATARRQSCRRRSQTVCFLVAVAVSAYFGLLGLSDSLQQSQTAVLDACAELSEPALGPIPRVLHQVFLDGEEAYQVEAAEERPAFRVEWRDACRQHYSNWEYRFWTQVRSNCWITPSLRTTPPLQPFTDLVQRVAAPAVYIFRVRPRRERRSCCRSSTRTSCRHGAGSTPRC